jgi:putative membrane protein
MFKSFVFAGALTLAPLAGAYAQSTAPSDPQIAHIAYTAGQLDIEAAEQALAKSMNTEVRAFAETMKRDHTAVNQQAMALLQRLKVTPEANPTSTALSQSAATERQRLAGLSGMAFDRAYIDNEVAYHRTVNEALRGTLIPGAQNPELKALLERGLALFQEHQAHAEQLARSHVQ